MKSSRAKWKRGGDALLLMSSSEQLSLSLLPFLLLLLLFIVLLLPKARQGINVSTDGRRIRSWGESRGGGGGGGRGEHGGQGGVAVVDHRRRGGWGGGGGRRGVSCKTSNRQSWGCVGGRGVWRTWRRGKQYVYVCGVKILCDGQSCFILICASF